MKKENYLNHIDDPEVIKEVRRVIDKIQGVLNNHSVEHTDFLDPYSRLMAKTVLNTYQEIEYDEVSGLDSDERKVFIIYPSYYNYIDEDVKLRYLRIEGYLKEASHRDYLGSILSLGITRNKLGDIYVHDDFADIVVLDDIGDYILYNLNKVKNYNVSVREISREDLITIEDDYDLIHKVISSLRLDVYISAVYNLSRKESSQIIGQDRVKVNWEVIKKPSYELGEGDLVSVKGYGRSVLDRVLSRTKKDNLRTEIKKFI